MKFKGYVRPNGEVGVRNHLLIIPTVVCASTVAERIASCVEGAISLANQHGCCQIGADLVLTENVLIGLGTLVKRIVSPYKISLQTFASIRIKQT
jgi:altronate dehydratase large subunit